MTRPSKRTRKHDPRQLQFLADFERGLVPVPAEPSQETASHDHDQKLRRWLNEAIQQAPIDREQIASAMTALAGRGITKGMIDTWTGASRANRFPADLLSAFCAAVGNNHVMIQMADAIGMRLADTYEAQLARMGQWTLIAIHAQQQQRMLADAMPPLPLFAGRAP